MEATPARSTRGKRPLLPAVSPLLVVGATVEVLCEGGEWHAGLINKRERGFTQAERTQGGTQTHASAELRQLAAQEALTVVAASADGKWNVLPWLPPAGQSRRNAAIPQALWSTHVRVLCRRGTDGDTASVPLLGEMLPDERATLRAMRSFERGERCPAPGSSPTDAPPLPAEGVPPDAFTQRFLDGTGDTHRGVIGNPGVAELLAEMPHRRVVQEIFEAAGVPAEQRGSAKLCEAVHVAANVMAVDFQCWASTSGKGAAAQAGTVEGGSDLEAACAILGCGEAENPISAFQSIPAHSIKVFLLAVCSLKFQQCASDRGDLVFNTAGTIAALRDPTKLAARCLKLLSVISNLIKATQSKGRLSALNNDALKSALQMILDKGGLKDQTIDQLAARGVCETAWVARQAILKAAPHIHAGALARSDGLHEAVLWLGDNADIHKFGKECAPPTPSACPTSHASHA